MSQVKKRSETHPAKDSTWASLAAFGSPKYQEYSKRVNNWKSKKRKTNDAGSPGRIKLLATKKKPN